MIFVLYFDPGHLAKTKTKTKQKTKNRKKEKVEISVLTQKNSKGKGITYNIWINLLLKVTHSNYNNMHKCAYTSMYIYTYGSKIKNN